MVRSSLRADSDQPPLHVESQSHRVCDIELAPWCVLGRSKTWSPCLLWQSFPSSCKPHGHNQHACRHGEDCLGDLSGVCGESSLWAGHEFLQVAVAPSSQTGQDKAPSGCGRSWVAVVLFGPSVTFPWPGGLSSGPVPVS